MKKLPKFHSKITIEGGGGAGAGAGSPGHIHGYGINKSDSLRKKIYNAEYIIMSSREGIEVYKDRYNGNVGFISSDKFLDVSLRMLARHLYNGLTEVFQEGFVEDAKKELRKVLEKHSKVERIKD
jgi:hypothetical protein